MVISTRPATERRSRRQPTATPTTIAVTTPSGSSRTRAAARMAASVCHTGAEPRRQPARHPVVRGLQQGEGDQLRRRAHVGPVGVGEEDGETDAGGGEHRRERDGDAGDQRGRTPRAHRWRLGHASTPSHRHPDGPFPIGRRAANLSGRDESLPIFADTARGAGHHPVICVTTVNKLPD